MEDSPTGKVFASVCTCLTDEYVKSLPALVCVYYAILHSYINNSYNNNI